MNEYRPTFIKRNRQGRVFMAVGPLWWWIAGLFLIVAAGAVPIPFTRGPVETLGRDHLRGCLDRLLRASTESSSLTMEELPSGADP